MAANAINLFPIVWNTYFLQQIACRSSNDVLNFPRLNPHVRTWRNW